MLYKTLAVTAAALACAFVLASSAWACTTTLITKGASADGSVIVTHSDDNELRDQRIVHVPAMDHKPGDKRPVYTTGDEYYPRIVSQQRGPAYDLVGYPETKVLGYIEQVPHTYAYIDGNHGFMNEHQLMIGECSDGAKFQPEAKAGERLFYYPELSRVALERTKTAREAIKLMGALIDEYGFYGAGETLLVGDAREGWVMEICATPDPEVRGVWVAKKVPDGEIFVGANEFRIREVDPKDPDMMISPRLFEVCQKLGWWKPSDGPLDWLKTVGLGEYFHPYYSLRRVWRVFSLANPSLELPAWVEDGFTEAYPFSIKPAKKLTVADAMALHRDHYEGTEFDMTKGLAAGPFGSPTRFYGPYDSLQGTATSADRKMEGAWERPISMYYTGFTYVCQARDWLPDAIGGVAWIGLDVPYTTCYVPFYAGVTDLPQSYQTVDPQEFDRSKAWWAFNFVANWAEIKFQYMAKDILAKQKEIETLEMEIQAAVETAASELYQKRPSLARKFLTDYCTDNANRVVGQWWELAEMLIVKYDDGYLSSQEKPGQEVGYPKWWRDAVGYPQGPVSYKKPQDR